MSKLYVGSDMTVRYYKARAPDGTYFSSGTCTYALSDRTGTELSAGTLSYVPDSDGNFEGLIDRTVTATLAPGKTYTLQVDFESDGYEDRRRLKLQAAYREEE